MDTKPPTHKHSFLSTRMEKLQIDAAAIIIMVTTIPEAETAWEAFKQSIQTWMLETREGMISFQGSAGYFNIGDALNDEVVKNEKLKEILKTAGILKLQITSLNHIDNQKEYDECLYTDREAIEEKAG
jgi:hypothetical protein